MRTTWAGERWSPEGEERPLPQGILVGIGSAAVIVAGLVASALPQAEAAVRYGVLVVTVLAFTALTGVWGASLVVAGIGFLVFDGFLINQLGELSWHGSADLVRLTVLGAAVIFGRLLGDIYRLSRPVPPGRRGADPMPSSKFIKEDDHDA